MIEMPIRLNDVSEPPEEKIIGRTISAIAADQPDAVEAQLSPAGRPGAFGVEVVAVGHDSRVPIRPMGRTIRMSTSST